MDCNTQAINVRSRSLSDRVGPNVYFISIFLFQKSCSNDTSFALSSSTFSLSLSDGQVFKFVIQWILPFNYIDFKV